MLMRKWVCEAARQSGRQGHESLPDASIPDNLLSAYAGIVDEIEIGLTEYKSLGLQPALESKREDNALLCFAGANALIATSRSTSTSRRISSLDMASATETPQNTQCLKWAVR
jgi:hypothetical protein